jgi:hypothetical protein
MINGTGKQAIKNRPAAVTNSFTEIRTSRGIRGKNAIFLPRRAGQKPNANVIAPQLVIAEGATPLLASPYGGGERARVPDPVASGE